MRINDIRKFIGSYIYTDYEFIYEDEKYFFTETVWGTYISSDKPDRKTKKIILSDSKDVKLEIIDLPAVNYKKIRNVIYYKLKSHYADSMENLGFLFIILNKKIKNKVLLLVYNNKILSNRNIRNEHYFDILPFIIFAKSFQKQKKILFFFTLKKGFLIMVKINREITHIKFHKNKKEADNFIKNISKENDLFIYTNKSKTENALIFKTFLKLKDTIIYGTNNSFSVKNILQKINKFIPLINGTGIFIILILYLLNIYITDKKINLLKFADKRKYIVEKLEKIKKSVTDYNRKKSLLSQQSVYFYYLFKATIAAGKKVFFIAIEKPAGANEIDIESFTEKSKFMKNFISELNNSNIFSKIELEQTEQYRINNKNFIRFRLKIFID